MVLCLGLGYSLVLVPFSLGCFVGQPRIVMVPVIKPRFVSSLVFVKNTGILGLVNNGWSVTCSQHDLVGLCCKQSLNVLLCLLVSNLSCLSLYHYIHIDFHHSYWCDKPLLVLGCLGTFLLA